MIDDIVELPRPLKNRTGGMLSSYTPYEAPTSAFGLALGIRTEEHDLPICIGNEFHLLAGKQTPYRYKLMEHDDKVIREYVVLSDGPITSSDTTMFTLWMNQTERGSLKADRFYFWDVIDKAREHFGFQKCDMLSNEIRDTLKVTGLYQNYPGLDRAYSWSNDKICSLTNETDELDRLHMIRANISALDDAIMGDYFFHPTDVFRGITFPDRVGTNLHTGAGKILSKNVVVPKDLKWMKGPDFATKPYHMCLRSTKPPMDSAELHALVEYSGWFDVLKYVELIPYTELFVAFDRKGVNVMRAYDPYDNRRFKDLELDHLDDLTRANFTHLFEGLECLLPAYKSGSIYRSWGEEVYITIQSQNGKTKQFYFDMVYAALGSRMFVPVENHNQ